MSFIFHFTINGHNNVESSEAYNSLLIVVCGLFELFDMGETFMEERRRVLYTSLISMRVLPLCVYPCPWFWKGLGGSVHLITLGSLLAPYERGWTI